MKLNFNLDPNDPVRKELEAMGIESDPSSEYLISRRNHAVNYLPARKEESAFYLDVREILYAESQGHDVFLVTRDGRYNSQDRLKQLEKVLDSGRFLRISNSVIVNLKQVRRIESSILQKFVLHMANGDKVEVTRTYYYIFRDRLGI